VDREIVACCAISKRNASRWLNYTVIYIRETIFISQQSQAAAAAEADGRKEGGVSRGGKMLSRTSFVSGKFITSTAAAENVKKWST
jgi:hypothetical protein